MASIHFDDYFFSELSYKLNPNFNPEVTELDLRPDLEFGVNVLKKTSQIKTILNIKLGSLDTEDAGFMLYTGIIGIFSFDAKEIELYDIDFETFIKESTISILWSFVRPSISDLLTKGNRFPNYILPVVNVAKLVRENDLEITYEE